jgi:hypothetical protein
MRFAHLHRNRPARQLLIAAAAAACVGLMATPSFAQGRGGGGDGRGGGQPQGQRGQWQGGVGTMQGMGRMGRGMTEPTMTTRDLTRYADILELSEDQREAARALLDAYQQDVQANNQEMNRQMGQMRERMRDQDGGGWQNAQEVFQKIRAEKSKLDTGFMNDLKSLLEPAQEANWSRFERTHTREKGINRGLMSGERVDVIKLVEDANLPPETRRELEPLLQQYEEDLHREIVNRDKVQEQLMGRMGQIRPGPDMDMTAMQRAVEEGRQASVRVRDLNRKYARQVQSALPEEHQFEFARAVKQASFPDIYREGYSSRVLASAAGLADLEESQREGLTAIRQTYQREVAILNDNLATAQEETEMNFDMRQLANRGRDAGPLSELRRQKRELEESTIENIRKVLTPEQMDRLPQQENRGAIVGGPEGTRGQGDPPRQTAPRRGGDRR